MEDMEVDGDMVVVVVVTTEDGVDGADLLTPKAPFNAKPINFLNKSCQSCKLIIQL
jgi:hypothetical protein